METAILVINKNGRKLAKRLHDGLENSFIITLKKDSETSLRALVGKVFNEYEGIVFCAAMGIVVRSIAPFVTNKFSDPAVVCVDTAGRFAVSVLSGHEGGANTLAFAVAECIGAIPVITTGTEAHKRFIIGIGCRRGIPAKTVRRVILGTLKANNIRLNEVRLAATIYLKRDEEGLRVACSALGLPLVFFSKEEIEKVTGGISASDVVERHIGLKGVCEPCALLAGRRTQLIRTKKILDGITIAIAREN